MNSNLLIKYVEQNEDFAGFDLGLLGESFTGFNDVLKELFEISQIQGELVIKTTSITEGSIDVNNLLQVIYAIPFNNVKDFLDFLQVVDKDLYQSAGQFFNTLGHGHKTINDFFNEHQFDNALISGLVVVYFPKMISWAGKQKKKITTRDESGATISESYAKKLKQMVDKGKYKKALKPVVENNISTIHISSTSKEKYSAIIDEENLGNYLPEEEQILPELENGTVHNFKGEILALQSTRGETLRFKILGIEPKYQLVVAHPADGKKTEDYMSFYKKQVTIKAEIYRKTLYRKPEIIILDIELMQQNLFNE